MPISTIQLSKMLGGIRDQTAESLRKLDQETEAALEYFNEKFDYYKAERGLSRPAPILVSKTPGKTAKPEAAASTKGMGLNHERKLADTSTNQVSSSAYDHNDVSLSRKTLRPRRIKLECEEFIDSDHDGSPPVLEIEPFKLPKAPSKKQTLSSSKLSSKPAVSKPDQITSTISAAKLPSEIEASGSISGARYPTRSSKRLRDSSILENTSTQSTTKALVQGRGRKGDSNSDESKILDEPEYFRESIGANTTYDIVTTTSKKSTGMSRTFVKESLSKESIGANATYVVDSQSKESIKTCSSISQDSPPCKKSIGANSTFTVDTSNREKGSLPDVKAAALATDDLTSSSKITKKIVNVKASAGKTTPAVSGSTVKKAPKKADCSSLKAARKSLSRAKELKIKILQGNHFENGASQMVQKKQMTNFTKVVSGHGNFIKVQPSPWRAPPMPSRNSPAPSQADHVGKLALKVLHNVSKQKSTSKVVDKTGKNIPCNGNMDGFKTHKEATFKNKILNEGFSFLSKESKMPAQETAFPNAIKPHSSVLCKSSNTKSGTSSYDITLNPEDRSPLPAKSETDYGLDDVHSDDSSDDESKPKKVVPPWAQASERSSSLQLQHNITSHQMFAFFESARSTPDLTDIFEKIDKRLLLRRSSAVWKSLEK